MRVTHLPRSLNCTSVVACFVNLLTDEQLALKGLPALKWLDESISAELPTTRDEYVARR